MCPGNQRGGCPSSGPREISFGNIREIVEVGRRIFRERGGNVVEECREVGLGWVRALVSSQGEV